MRSVAVLDGAQTRILEDEFAFAVCIMASTRVTVLPGIKCEGHVHKVKATRINEIE